MGSLVELHQHLRDDSHMDMVVPKSEPNHEGSCSSSVSTPEPDGEAVVQDATQRQKRKGGRKPIYATSEERKQRNRQAQAAFRERRTEYIKQLETTIKHNEDTLQSLQQSHRSAADECLMLRYKNSLLERILLEKGIDVQAELRLKSGSPNPPPSKLAGSLANQASPLQRTAAGGRHRHNAGIAPKLEQTNVPQAHREGLYNIHSPQLQPTPPSHTSSPSTTKSPSFAFQGGMSPTGTDIQAQQQQQHNSHPHQRPPLLPQPGPFSQGSRPVTAAPSDSLEPVVTSQSIMPGSTLNTTQQEYDAQTDMVDDPDPDESADVTPYAPDYRHPPGVQQNGHPSVHPHPGEVDGISAASFFDHFDPMLDADPFGLTASMHFQTPFSYTQSHARQ